MTRVALLAATVLSTLLGVFLLWQVREAVVLFLLSLAAAAAARPPVAYLTARRVPKTLAVVGIYLGALGLLALLVSLAVPALAADVQSLARDCRELYRWLIDDVAWPAWLRQSFAQNMPSSEELFSAVAGQHGSEALRVLLGTAFGLFDSIINLVVIVVLSIYWALDQERFERLWLSLLPVAKRAAARSAWRAVEAEVGAYLRSEAAQCVLAGAALAFALTALGFPYPLLMACIAGLAWLVPWLGLPIALAALLLLAAPSLVAAPAAAGLRTGGAALLIAGVFAALERLVEPRMFHRGRYNSLLMVLAVIALANWFGLLGLLLGPMLAVVLQVLAEHAQRLRTVPRRPPPAELSDLAERMEQLKLATREAPAPSAETAGMIARLEALVQQAQEVRKGA